MKPESIRKKVGDIFSEHLDRLQLVGYNLFIFIPTDKKWEKPTNDSFSVNLNFPYKRIKLYVGHDVINGWNKTPLANITSSLLHEAIHVLVWPFAEMGFRRFINQKQLDDREEYLVESIKAILEGKK